MSARPRRPESICARLPVAPLVTVVEGRGGYGACIPEARGSKASSTLERAWERAQAQGWVTVKTADELAIRVLGLHPLLVWGDDWLVPVT